MGKSSSGSGRDIMEDKFFLTSAQRIKRVVDRYGVIRASNKLDIGNDNGKEYSLVKIVEYSMKTTGDRVEHFLKFEDFSIFRLIGIKNSSSEPLIIISLDEKGSLEELVEYEKMGKKPDEERINWIMDQINKNKDT
jgi:hypothetical protein